ncbi:MAG: HAD-IIA family hydrolase [Actinomycetota bacterium]|nr:HAD-IIA family hydrolase [Actinomycetota bacterium]
MSLADSYDGFLIDLDGVVWLGHQLIPGAAETVSALAASGKRFAFVTNSPRLSPARQANLLRDAGVPARDEQLITAGLTLIRLALDRLRTGAAVLDTGTPSFRDQVKSAGFELLEPAEWQRAEAVLLTGHDRFDYAELKATAMAARKGILFAATGRDPTMPMPDGLWPGTGSILAAVETAAGRTATITGKPEAAIFQAGLDALELPPEAKVAMVGDRLDTDVEGAQRAGFDGILVAGNDSSPAAGTGEITPQHRIDTLAGLLD